MKREDERCSVCARLRKRLLRKIKREQKKLDAMKVEIGFVRGRISALIGDGDE